MLSATLPSSSRRTPRWPCAPTAIRSWPSRSAACVIDRRRRALHQVDVQRVAEVLRAPRRACRPASARRREHGVAHGRPREPRLAEQRRAPRAGGELPRVDDVDRHARRRDERGVRERLAPPTARSRSRRAGAGTACAPRGRGTRGRRSAARRIVDAATLPSSSRAMPVWPCEPTTISSAARSAAVSTSTSSGGPTPADELGGEAARLELGQPVGELATASSARTAAETSPSCC